MTPPTTPSDQSASPQQGSVPTAPGEVLSIAQVGQKRPRRPRRAGMHRAPDRASITHSKEEIARSSRRIAFRLESLGSDFAHRYHRTGSCGRLVNGRTFRCKQPWCEPCYRRRQAALVRRYGWRLSEWEPYLLTLSRESVVEQRVRDETVHSKEAIKSIVRSLRRTRKLEVRALRKIEVVWNGRTNRFHVHVHVLIDGHEAARAMRDAWIDRHRETADPKAQDLRSCRPEEVDNVIAYLGKPAVVPRSVPGKPAPRFRALDVIYRATKGRLLEAYGVTPRRRRQAATR